jgi:hemerythrin-like metal-binding protein
MFDEMCVYTNAHFAYEERLFEKYNYPKALEHTEIHKKFSAKLEKLHNDYKNGSDMMSTLMLTEMRTWLVEHIRGEDRLYVDHLVAKGVK